MRIPDPVELHEDRIERMMAEYVEGECMECHAKVDYELICMGPMGDGPAVCEPCAGYPFGLPENTKPTNTLTTWERIACLMVAGWVGHVIWILATLGEIL